MLSKNLFLGAAALTLFIAAAATANANATFTGTDNIWSADTSNHDDVSTAAIQQALPSAVSHFVNFGDSFSVFSVVTSTGTFTSQQLNFNEPSGTDNIGTF